MNINELPGAEFVLPGLDDLHKGESHTIGPLLVGIAATRLAATGLSIPVERLAPDSELTLYNMLENEREDAYSYYNALIKRFESFCNALESLTSPIGME